MSRILQRVVEGLERAGQYGCVVKHGLQKAQLREQKDSCREGPLCALLRYHDLLLCKAECS